MCVRVAALVYVNTNMYNSYISVLLQTKGKLICAFIYFFYLVLLVYDQSVGNI